MTNSVSVDERQASQPPPKWHVRIGDEKLWTFLLSFTDAAATAAFSDVARSAWKVDACMATGLIPRRIGK